MTVRKKIGPYSVEELERIWLASVDDGYSEPLTETTEDPETGFTTGIEVYRQGFEQLARVSEAVNRNFQAMFLQEWSGQSNPPAAGATKATVQLSFERANTFQRLLVVREGTKVQEVQTEMTEEGGVEFLSGRRYDLLTPLVLFPGEQGPKTVTAQAELSGYGYNNPMPWSISRIFEPGAGSSNGNASVVASTFAGTDMIRLDPSVDTITEDFIGEYIQVLAGANTGQIRRIVEWVAPLPDQGPRVALGRDAAVEVADSSFTAVGQTLTGAVSGATGNVLAIEGNNIAMTRVTGTFQAGELLEDLQLETDSAILRVLFNDAPFTLELDSLEWRILAWETEFGVTAYNLEHPEGGGSAMLDFLARDRNLFRTQGESDSGFRDRVANLPDVVSPNAIRRAANRILQECGTTKPICFREVGSSLFPGFFYDQIPEDSDAFPNAYDLDPEEFPYHVYLDTGEMRAFFLLGIPVIPTLFRGMAYDDGTENAYDALLTSNFYDVEDQVDLSCWQQIWVTVNEIKAAGVGFDLYLETGDCC